MRQAQGRSKGQIGQAPGCQGKPQKAQRAPNQDTIYCQRMLTRTRRKQQRSFLARIVSGTGAKGKKRGTQEREENNVWRDLERLGFPPRPLILLVLPRSYEPVLTVLGPPLSGTLHLLSLQLLRKERERCGGRESEKKERKERGKKHQMLPYARIQ